MPNPLVVADDIERVDDRIQIIKRFSHAHEDEVRYPSFAGGRAPFGQIVPGDLDLGHDLIGRQVAHQRLGAGMTKGAIERAADLARNAKRAVSAADLGDENGFGLDSRSETDQPFHRPVAALPPVDDLGPTQCKLLGQGGTRFPSDIAHRIEVGDPVIVDPPPDLTCPHPSRRRGYDPAIDERRCHPGAGHPGEVRASREGTWGAF